MGVLFRDELLEGDGGELAGGGVLHGDGAAGGGGGAAMALRLVPKVRRDWRGWTTAAVIWGLLLTERCLDLHAGVSVSGGETQPLAGTAAYDKSWWNPRKWVPAAMKLRGCRCGPTGLRRFAGR